MDEGEYDRGVGSVCVSPAAVEEVEVRHAKALLEKAGDVPLDVARTILAAHYRTLRACESAGVKRLAGGFIQCPSCSTPWMADLCRPRLLGCPRNVKAIRRIARRSRTHPGKLTRVEKSRLACYYNRTNAMEVLCLVCGHRKEEFFALPQRDEKVKEEEVEVRDKKRKKKRRGKELNAGLLLSTNVMERKVKVGNEAESQASPITYLLPKTSAQIDANTPDTSKNTPDSHNATPKYSSTSTQRPKTKRAKVTIRSVSTPPSLPVPLTNVMKEKRKARSYLKKAMSKESARSDLCNGGGKTKNSLSSFLDSLL